MIDGFPIDGKALGPVMLLESRASYKYENKVRTNELLGYKMRILVPALNYMELRVLLPDDPKLTRTDGEPQRGIMEGLVIKPYLPPDSQNLAYRATASGFHVVGATPKA